ncbi:MAG: lipoate protein ligase C-terminal domain-containing protein [Thermoproteota archaeon]
MIQSNPQETIEAKLLTLKNRRVEEALSIFEALSSRLKPPECPLIILHSNKGKIVSLGCFQVADEDFLTGFMRKRGLKYFFRLHGGDVMLHDENQVGVALILPMEEKYRETYVSLMSLLLKKNGVSNIHVTNDSILCFNKVLGEVIHVEKNGFSSWFAFIYLKRNYEEMAGLKFPKEQLIKERVSKLKENYIGLDQVLEKQVSADAFLESVKTVLTDDLGFKIREFKLGLGEKKLFWKNRDMLKNNRISESVQLKHSALLREEGALLISKRLMNGFLRMRLKIKDKTLEKISISGSFMFEPSEKLRDFEKMLEGKELDETVLTEKVTEFFINEKVKASFTAFEIVELLCGAAGGLNEHGDK